MALQRLKISDFRCVESAELAPEPHYNLIYGENASGKTSLLEAIAYLGRGKSFRGATTQNLVRHGCGELLLLGRVTTESRVSTVGVRNSSKGLEIKIDGEGEQGSAALAELLPLQVIGPDIHSLVAGGPEERRRHLDWIAFHVERGYLSVWRRYRRVLKQRNAALRDGADNKSLASWDQEFLDAALLVDASRRAVTELANRAIQSTGELLLGHPVRIEYRGGWGMDQTLQEALAASFGREREVGATQVGPHRADLKLVVENRQARKLVSRGQQKLLACALILTAAELVQTHLERPLLLLLDDPAAELDNSSLARLMASVTALGCQVIATALEPDAHLFPDDPALFHVEHGNLIKLD